VSTALATQASTVQSALIPKITIPATVAGSIAIITSSIILLVDEPF
jgi:hypothetical protein